MENRFRHRPCALSDATLDVSLTLTMSEPSGFERRECRDKNNSNGLMCAAVRLTTTSRARIVALSGSAAADEGVVRFVGH